MINLGESVVCKTCGVFQSVRVLKAKPGCQGRCSQVCKKPNSRFQEAQKRSLDPKAGVKAFFGMRPSCSPHSAAVLPSNQSSRETEAGRSTGEMLPQAPPPSPQPTPAIPKPKAKNKTKAKTDGRAQAETVPTAPIDGARDWRPDQLSPCERRVKLRSTSASSRQNREGSLSPKTQVTRKSPPSRTPGALIPERRLRHSPRSTTPPVLPIDQGGSRKAEHPQKDLALSSEKHQSAQSAREDNLGGTDADAETEGRSSGPQVVAFHFYGKWEAPPASQRSLYTTFLSA